MTKRSLIRGIQDRAFAALGRLPDQRASIVDAMLRSRRGDAAGYWLQLGIATMLATLGLALDSTAVVIGAMLIAPLMRPIVELAMGLATGSAVLVVRAAVRIGVSIAVVVLVAIAITWLLPFHSITAELEARTAPTLLDLVVAGACAIAAAYATLRADADVATTAAGTSIGISLAPPICATGYAITIGDHDAARGAALLFTANLSGILVVATALFVALGFARVGVRELEAALDEADGRPGTASRVGRAWSKWTARFGPLTRMMPPLLLAGAVFVPLRRAIGEIKQRAEISRRVADVLARRENIVQYTLDQTASAVVVRAVAVGNSDTASELDRRVRASLAEIGVASAHVSIWAVPDAASVSALAHRVDEIPPPPAPEPVANGVHRFSTQAAKTIREAWPRVGTGEVIAIALDLDTANRIRITHLGAAIGEAGTQLLATALAPTLGPVDVREDALTPVSADVADGHGWLAGAIDLALRTRSAGLQTCVTLPAVVTKPRAVDPFADVRAVIHQLLDGRADATISTGEGWKIEAARACSGSGSGVGKDQ